MRRSSNIHAWFYACLPASDPSVKETVIRSYSGGQTASLRELYTHYRHDYERMRRELTKDQGGRAELDQARKRLIAVVFAFLEGEGYCPDTNYVKRVACNAAGTETFNDIPLNTLKALYRRFGENRNNINHK